MPKNFSMYHNIGVGSEAGEANISSVRFQYFCGTMETSVISRFQRIAYRLTRGNVYMLVKDIPEDETKSIDMKEGTAQILTAPSKSIFFMAFQLGGSEIVKAKLVKLCQAFNSTLYNLPSSYEEFDTEIATLIQECANCKEVKSQTEERILKSLNVLANPLDDNEFSYLRELKMRVLREKSIYDQFNKLKLRDNIFYGKLWIPREHEGKVKMTLDVLGKRQNFSRADIEFKDFKLTKYTPPTYFKLNEFTMPF